MTPSRASRLRIVVVGYLVRGPLGGLAWHHLQYVVGLTQLGHDVHFIEDSDDYPSCYDPRHDRMDVNPEYGLAFVQAAFDRLGLRDRWSYYDAHRHRWLGPAADRAVAICTNADMLLNLSCLAPWRSWLERPPIRVLVDTDPVFTQIRHLGDPVAKARAAAHTAFFTFGENISQDGCSIPPDGFPWRATRQPVVMDAWPWSPGVASRPLSTVMLWDSYRAAEHGGRRYGMKSDSFAQFLDLPCRCHDSFELALGAPAAPRQALAAHGWTVVDPREPTRDPWTYQDYIKASKAEFSVAKHGYVVSQSGWFSERSAAYLASGRPVVVQETGFSRWLRADEGVFAFTNAEEAVAQLDTLNGSYADHCRAARAVAGDYFGSAHVLSHLLESART